jgi:hypothetical protein
LRVFIRHGAGKADGAMQQNFLINGGNGFLKGWQMPIINPLAGW